MAARKIHQERGWEPEWHGGRLLAGLAYGRRLCESAATLPRFIGHWKMSLTELREPRRWRRREACCEWDDKSTLETEENSQQRFCPWWRKDMRVEAQPRARQTAGITGMSRSCGAAQGWSSHDDECRTADGSGSR